MGVIGAKEKKFTMMIGPKPNKIQEGITVKNKSARPEMLTLRSEE